VKPIEAWAVHLSTILVGGTGLVYAWMRYLAAPSDPFAVVNHPWQPAVQHLHVWTAPLLVFCAGLIWREHIWKHWKKGVRHGRRSGLSLMLTLAPMVLSGYLIQTAVGEGWRQAWVAVHLASSGLWLLGHTAHAWALVRKLAVSRRTSSAGESALTVRSASPAEATERR
jgi:hypothetical protein